MKCVLEWFDVQGWYREHPGVQPATVLPAATRRPGSLLGSTPAPFRYMVPGSLLEAAVRFSLTRTGDGVRIPLHAYRTRGADTSAWLLAEGFELGFRAVSALHAQDPRAVIRRVVLVVGKDVEVFRDPPGLRVYLGAAIELEP